MKRKIKSIALCVLLLTPVLPVEVANDVNIDLIDNTYSKTTDDGFKDSPTSDDQIIDFLVSDVHNVDSPSQNNYNLGPLPSGQSPIADAGSDQTANVGDVVQLDGSGSYDPDGDFSFTTKIKLNDDGLTDVGQYYPSITIDKMDTIHVVWGDNRNEASYGSDIYYTKSNTSGNSFFPNVRVNEDKIDASQGGPVIATNENLDVFVAWSDFRDYADGGHPKGVYFARSIDYGQTFEPSIKVNDFPGARSIFTEGLAIDTYKNDTVYLAWEDTRNTGTTGLDMYFANSTDRGVTFGTNVKISDDIPNVEHSISMDVGMQGTIYLMWQVTIAPVTTRNITFSKSTDAGNTFSQNKFIMPEHNYGSGPSMALDKEGVINFVWHDKFGSSLDAFFSRSSDDGNTFSSRVRVNEYEPTYTQAHPRIALNSDGDIYVVWEDWRSGKAQVYFSMSRDNGQTFRKDIRVSEVSTRSIDSPQIAVDSEGIPHVVWRDRSGDRLGDIYYSKGIHSLSYDWDFGDGSPHGSGIRPTHVYSNSGTYTVTLTVTDGEGGTDTDYCTVTILGVNEPPNADAGPDQAVYEGDLVQFDGSGSNDPDGMIVIYDWDFGDGLPHGSGVASTHIYNTTGNYSVTLTVVDNQNATDTDTCIIAVLPSIQPPVADAGDDQNAREGDLVFFDGSNSKGGRQQCLAPPSDLVSWWPGDDNANDLIGANHGTLLGGTTFEPGVVGQAFSFDGYNDRVSVPDSDNLKITGSMTIDAWLFIRSFPPPLRGHAQILFRGDDRGGLDPYYLSAQSNGNIRFHVESLTARTNLEAPIPKDEFVFVAATLDDATGLMRIYLNGALAAEQITSIRPFRDLHPSYRPGIGIGNHAPSSAHHQPFHGIIDELEVFNRALSESEIQAIYNAGSFGKCKNSGGSNKKIVSYEWDFESDGIYDYIENQSYAPDGNFDGNTTHVYGDNGVFMVTLRVTDETGANDTDTCSVTVFNVDPTLTIEYLPVDVEIGLRVAGRKYNDVGMVLFENNATLGNVSIERLPGSPNEQMAWIPVTLNLTRSCSVIVTYTPKDPPNIGANPVWIYIKFPNGSIKKVHHNFNVQQSKKRDSDHWNHVEPWEVDLNECLVGWPFEVAVHITDPGSDDEIITCIYDSQNFTATYLNDPPDADPDPSPEVNPRDIMDTITMVYEGAGIVTLIVDDDDGGTMTTNITLA
ncbi:MAG: PKD domain-containing protein [Thermoplasmata archaeon]|nr:MAG: PKD domain-containing protein [Thermoplasmata archaeon]